jgi:hypothetical protein
MDYLDQTIEVWQPYKEQPLTREDAREIAHNVIGFFHVLRQWADEEKRAPVLPKQTKPAPSGSNGKTKADCLPLPNRKRRQKRAAAGVNSGS